MPVLARAYDRGHALDLLKAGVDYQIRETYESALNFSEKVLTAIGEETDLAERLIEEFRDVDKERFALEVVGGVYAGRSLIRGNAQPADIVAARTARERAEREAREEAREDS